MYKKILFCYDGSAEGRRALRQGGEVALAMRADAYLLAICRTPMAAAVPDSVAPLVNVDSDTAERLLNEGVQRLRDAGLRAEGALMYGDPLVHIPEVAAQIGADLVVIGHRQRGRLARYWTQSLEESLLYRLSCSILVAVAPKPAEEI